MSEKKPTSKKLVEDLVKKSNTTMAEMRRSFHRISSSCEKTSQENYESIQFMLKEFKSFSEIFTSMKNTLENVDETLGNVLLAIRQNEFLQAHYPAQHGYPEMKVTGKHPSKIVQLET